MRHFFFLFIFALCSGAWMFSSQKTALKLTLTNISNHKAKFWVALFKDKKGFPSNAVPHKYYTLNPPATGSSATYELTGLDYGTYAMAIYQDEDNNEKLSTNMFGYPKEPFGFSNNFKPVFSGPSFEDCQFSYSETSNSLTINLIQ